MGLPLQIEIEGEPFEIMTERCGGTVYFYLHMTHAIDERKLQDMLSSIITRNDLRKKAQDGRLDDYGKVLTLDDIIPGFDDEG
jgi:hypothetical protein